jgi:rhodanese-related sulfurtransferase
VAGKLIKKGYNDVAALKGGWKEWLKKNYATESK